MDYRAALRTLARQPLPHQVLMAMLRDYGQPNAKIHALIKEGSLQSIRKGLYITGPAISADQKPEPFLVANHILGPSYVSVETALSYHGFIPERVYEIASMTTKSSRAFATPLGNFSYTKLPLPYYAFGIDSVKLGEGQFALVASPEKALFDKIVTSTGLLFRSKRSAREYLVENMRMDEDTLRMLNTDRMATWISGTLKEESLSMILSTLSDL
jgi:hypothetical protein